MSDIAKGVGITPPGLYWHFPSKEDILYAFLQDSIKQLSDRIRRALGNGSPPDELRKFISTHVLYHLEDLEASQTYGLLHESDFLGALSREHRARIETLLRRYRYMCQEILKRGLDEGYFVNLDPTVTAFALLTMGEQVVSWFNHSGRLSADEVAELYAELAVRMCSNSC
jgi:AcrR family transcriptional regulator